MPRGGVQFSSEELVCVLSHYDIGVILRIKPLSGGNRRSPKMVVISEQGKYLLKRRPRGKDDLARVVFAHEIQRHLEENDFPVTILLATRKRHETALRLDHHIYELFEFVSGSRYDGSPEETAEAARQLARFHRLMADYPHGQPPINCYHDSSAVRRHLKTIGTNRSALPSQKMRVTSDTLMRLYNDSSICVSELGFDSWPRQIIHGDWHPGNMLFSRHKIAALLDFDSIRVASPVTDLANAMLQFSIVSGRPNPNDWPDYFDEDKLARFIKGYRSVAELDKNKLDALVDLMIETMIAEAVLPIAATGFFGHLSGTDFLDMILRKAKWLDKHRDKLIPTFCW
ncbi:MAG: phosphotransferase [Sedimentisphaerales bacterium]|nr:phosphotransferase [Sedimentisphaerales bacterium]